MKINIKNWRVKVPLGVLLYGFLVFCSAVVYGSGVQIKGSSTGILTGKCLKNDNVRGKKDKEIFSNTLRDAKKNAVQRYVANSGIATAGAFESKKLEILGFIDDFILNPNIRVLCDRGSKSLKVSVTGELNKSAFDRTLALDQIAMGKRSRLTSIFVARKQSEVKAFDGKRTVVNRSTEMSEASQVAQVGNDGSISAEGLSVNTVKTEDGGNTTYKADQIKYKTFRPDGLETAINAIFVSLGYRPINNSQVEAISGGEFNVSQFEEEFASTENISNETLSNAFKAIANDIPLLVLAKLDVGAPFKSRGNEQPTIIVDVNAQIYRYDGRFYETVASYGPVQIQRSGLTSTAAENNAILEAATVTARQLGSQLLQNKIF